MVKRAQTNSGDDDAVLAGTLGAVERGVGGAHRRGDILAEHRDPGGKGEATDAVTRILVDQAARAEFAAHPVERRKGMIGAAILEQAGEFPPP